MKEKLKILYKQCLAFRNTLETAVIEQFAKSGAFVAKYNQL